VKSLQLVLPFCSLAILIPCGRPAAVRPANSFQPGEVSRYPGSIVRSSISTLWPERAACCRRKLLVEIGLVRNPRPRRPRPRHNCNAHHAESRLIQVVVPASPMVLSECNSSAFCTRHPPPHGRLGCRDTWCGGTLRRPQSPRNPL